MDGVKNIQKILKEDSQVPTMLEAAYGGAFFGYEHVGDSQGNMCFWLTEVQVSEGESVKEFIDPYVICDEYTVLFGDFMEQYRSVLGSIREGFCSIGEDACHRIEQMLNSYFRLLFVTMRHANEAMKKDPDHFLRCVKLLTELLFINSKRQKNYNCYQVSAKHPFMIMCNYEELLAGNFLKDLEKDGAAFNADHAEMLGLIFEAKYRNKRQLMVYTNSQVFEIAGEAQNSVYKAQAFAKQQGNTKIQAIRLIEKIDSYRKKCSDKKCTRIASLGELTDIGELQAIYGEDVMIEQFTRKPELGKYYFASESGDMYDLLNISDLNLLYKQYQIVLLLDLNCFYRQRQRSKSIKEENEVSNCEWYLYMVDQFEEFKDKARCYELLYKHIGMWLNSYYEDKSATYEFDEKLYLALDAAKCATTDVYVYIKYGDQIAGRDLLYSNVCNDEYYDGRQLIVYKFGQDEKIDEECEKFLGEQTEEYFYTEINFWKILKSISNEYCSKILKRMEQELGKTEKDVIKACRKSWCVLAYSMEGEEITIRYCVRTKGEDAKRIENLVEKITDVVLCYAFDRKKIPCVYKYFQELIVHCIISNARDISDLVFAHMLSNCREVTKMKSMFEEIGKQNQNESIDENKDRIKNRFKIRKMLYSVISKLEELRLRNVEDREGYLSYTFRKENCPELSERVFRQALKEIAECCKKFQYTKSALYVNSKLD